MRIQVDFHSFYGNQALLDALSMRIRTRPAAHAYLLEGPAGSGKKTLSLLLSAALCCEDAQTVPCGRCINCRKILSRQSPDVIVLGDGAETEGKKTKSIGVDVIRSLKDDAYIRPNDLERKIYIITRADSMTVQAQNALLKVLEEPPASVLFFLLCENASALLSTVRSRVQCLRMECFSDADMKEILLSHEKKAQALAQSDAPTLDLFVRLSRGAYGKALSYLSMTQKQLSEDETYMAYTTALDCFSAVFGADPGEGVRPGGVRTSVGRILAARCEKREQLRGLLTALCGAARDLLLCTYGGDAGELLFFPRREMAEAIANRCESGAVFRFYTQISAARDNLDANPGTTLLQGVITGAFYDLYSG